MLGVKVGIYRYHQEITAPDTTTVTFEGPKAKREQTIELTYMAVVNETTNNKLLKLGIRDSDKVDHIISAREAAQWKCARMFGKVFLIEGESPIGIVTTPTANDVLSFAVHGVIYEPKPR